MTQNEIKCQLAWAVKLDDLKLSCSVIVWKCEEGRFNGQWWCPGSVRRKVHVYNYVAGGKSVKQKMAGDIWVLVGSIMNNYHMKRKLKNVTWSQVQQYRDEA